MNENKLLATIEHIIFQNPENGYTVCDVATEDDFFTVTGYLPYINEGERIEMTGDWICHPDYGEQFHIEDYTIVLPCTEDEILKYLSQGTVAGVGEKTAKNLVAHFGEKTLDIMLSEPMRMTEIKGISPKKAQKISESFAKVQQLQSIVVFLQQFNISSSVAMRVGKYYGTNCVNLLKQNPYLLTAMTDPVSFKIADNIAMSLGFAKNSILRIRYAILNILSHAAFKSGHTYLFEKEIISMVSSMLEVTQDEAKNGIDELIVEKFLHTENIGNEKICMTNFFYRAETFIALRLFKMASDSPSYRPSDELLEEIIKDAQKESDIVLVEEQLNAVKTALSRRILVITGGPGTGKTTILKTIVSAMDKLEQEIVLTAPTGRAAKRMSECTALPAKTIHRLIGIKPDETSNALYNEENPLPEDVIIVDEASMIDLPLFYSLMLAIKPTATLILCGDSNQLPSVGPGNILKDIIASQIVPVISLSHIHRQARESMIVMNSHKIKNALMPDLSNKSSDFFFLSRSEPYAITQTIVDLYKNRLPNSYGIDPVSKIQVLAPSKRGPCGTVCINEEIQLAMNPPDILKPECSYGKGTFRVGDKVMQIKNDYDIGFIRSNGEIGTGIFNGDMGIITDISLKDRTMNILFDEDKEVEYPFTNLDKLELAYCTTVHKSQGSEFDIVIMAAGNYAPLLMHRNLLYTALTRAKNIAIIVGRNSAVQQMVETATQDKRHTRLCERILSYVNEK